MSVKRIDELRDTLHYKGSKSDGSPSKSKHVHEYVRPFARVYIRLMDGPRSKEKHTFHAKTYCIHCGKIRNRLSTIKEALEIEVTPEELLDIREKQKVAPHHTSLL